jgi:hypothetical protein
MRCLFKKTGRFFLKAHTTQNEKESKSSKGRVVS